MNGNQPINYAQYDASTLEGLVLLATERVKLAEAQVPGILEHIKEQEQIVEDLTRRYNRDVAFINGAVAYVRGQPAPVVQAPWQPPAAASAPQGFNPMMGMAGQPNAVFNPLNTTATNVLPPQQQVVSGFPQGPLPSGFAVSQGQALPGWPAHSATPLAVMEQGGAPLPAQQMSAQLPFPNQQVHSQVISAPDGRRSHLIPGTLSNGQPGYVVDPNFVDEQGRRPVMQITPEMSEKWAQPAERSVEVYEPGTPGYVPAGGGALVVKRHTRDGGVVMSDGTPEPSNAQPASAYRIEQDAPAVAVEEPVVEQGPGT